MYFSLLVIALCSFLIVTPRHFVATLMPSPQFIMLSSLPKFLLLVVFKSSCLCCCYSLNLSLTPIPISSEYIHYSRLWFDTNVMMPLMSLMKIILSVQFCTNIRGRGGLILPKNTPNMGFQLVKRN